MKRTASAIISAAILVCLASPVLVSASQLNPSNTGLTANAYLYNNVGLNLDQSLNRIPNNNLCALNPSQNTRRDLLLD